MHQLYCSDVRDIDLWIGLNCERIPHDMIMSPTAAEIIAEQFSKLKYGDRFFVEHDPHLTESKYIVYIYISFLNSFEISFIYF